jgi:hypothetical protein
MIETTEMIKLTVVNGMIKMKSIIKVGNNNYNYGVNMTETRGKLKVKFIMKA